MSTTVVSDAPAGTPGPNRLARSLAKLERVPAWLRPWVRNWVLRRAVPFTGTAALRYEQLTADRVVVSIVNQRRVQNHIEGVHAAAMVLLAETATGMAVGMHVRDDCLPLAKTIHVDFKRRAQGNLRAVARVSQAQRDLMQKNDKGEVSVLVEVTDESGAAPIQCEYLWAWIPATSRRAPDVAQRSASVRSQALSSTD